MHACESSHKPASEEPSNICVLIAYWFFIYHSYYYLSRFPLVSTETICMTFRWVSRRLSASLQWCVLSWRSRFAGRLQLRCINAKETLPVTFSLIWSPSLYQQVHTICWFITSHTRSLYITQHHKLHNSPQKGVFVIVVCHCMIMTLITA